MKRMYKEPYAKKVNFEYDDQVVATSVYPDAPQGDPYVINNCTWHRTNSTCNIMFNTPKARGIDNCMMDGNG